VASQAADCGSIAKRTANVAMARRLAIQLYWMWRKGWDYQQVKKFGSHAGQLGTGDGVQ
jgi:transposase